jgi:hypothetical protein
VGRAAVCLATARWCQRLVSSDGYAAIQLYIPGEHPPQTSVAPEFSDRINKGKGTVGRSRFAFVINGFAFTSIDDTTLSSGTVGIFSINASWVRATQGAIDPAWYQTGEVVCTNFKRTAPLFGA